MNRFTITGNLVDVHRQKIYPSEINVEKGKIVSIKPIRLSTNQQLNYILPGFIDAHVHIESSMLVPAEFARLAVVHGTVATVSDPHEIANVCGMEGVDFMIENGKTVLFKFYFGAPGCVPATTFETAGATLDSAAVEILLRRDEIKYLAEMMNFPGVLHGDEEVMKKITAAHRLGKPVDGHAPGLRGEMAKKYIEAGAPSIPIAIGTPEGKTWNTPQIGISTDHECFTKEEAQEKLGYGMKIIIREGSAAKNFEALVDLLHDHSDMMMFCSDDKHPDSLVNGHINQLCERAVAKGINIFKVLKAACVNPVEHYKLEVGLLKEGDPADFIVVKDIVKFEVLQTYINGALVAENGKSLILRRDPDNYREANVNHINNFSCNKKTVKDFEVPAANSPRLRRGGGGVIEALDGQLITNKIFLSPKIESRLLSGGNMVSDVERDLLKIVVVNRYNDAPVAKAFIKNFGLKKGAIASSVAHDSHNIVAVGVDDESICKAVNLLIDKKGGISITGASSLSFGEGRGEAVLPLPVGGLMSNEDGYEVAKLYTAIDKAAKELGSQLSAPYMTLSFMALLVIPHLKLSDKGLFDGDSFEFVK